MTFFGRGKAVPSQASDPSAQPDLSQQAAFSSHKPQSSIPIQDHDTSKATSQMQAQHGNSSQSSQDSTPSLVKENLASEETLTADMNQDEPQDDEDDILTGWKLFTVLFGLVLAVFLMCMSASVVATALPKITTQFNTVADIGWYGSAYLLANCSLGPLSGKIYTYCSLKWTFVSFLLIFEFGSLICALSTSSNMFIVGRAVAGAGGSGIFNGAITILAAAVPFERRPTLIGIATSFAGVSQLAGPIIGGAITSKLSWRWCFWIDLPGGGVAAVLLALMHIPDGARKRHRNMPFNQILARLDLPGFALFAPAIIMILLAAEWGGTSYAWHSATIIGLFCGSSAVFVVWFFWQRRRGDDAMIPLGYFKDHVVMASCATAFLQFGAQLLLTQYLPVWFQAVKGRTPFQSGVDTLPTMISQLIAAGLGGKLVSIIGYVAPIAIFGSVCSALGSGLLSTLAVSSGIGPWLGYQVLAGIGRGIVIQAPVIAAQSVLKPSEVAVGSALVVFSQYFGGALFLALGQTLFISRLKIVLPKLIPNFNTDLVVDSGATTLSNLIPLAFAPIIIKAYNIALTQTFYLAAGGSVAAIFTSAAMGWKSIRASKTRQQRAESSKLAGDSPVTVTSDIEEASTLEKK